MGSEEIRRYGGRKLWVPTSDGRELGVKTRRSPRLGRTPLPEMVHRVWDSTRWFRVGMKLEKRRGTY